MNLRQLLVSGVLAGTVSGVVLADDAGGGAAGEAASSSTELEAVTVTARRREETLQQVPLAISVIDGSELDQTGSFNVARLQQLAPTLQFYASNPRNSFANIRGLGAPFGLTNDGIEQGVGLYVDDVYYSRAASSTLDFLDVERIEVLRGPQGTLYGKNTTAGAINITTRAPGFTPEGSAEVTAGNLGFYQAKGALSGPLIADRLAGRVAFSSTTRHGTVYDVATSTRINELDNIGVRGQLLWEAGDGIAVTFAGDYNKQNPDCCGQIFVRVGPNQRAAARQYWGLAARDFDLNAPGVQSYAPPSTNPFDRLTDLDAPLSARNELGGASARVVWNTGAGTFTSVTAWRYWDWRPQNDRDFTGLPITTRSQNPSTQDQLTQEFRYAYSRDRFDYVIGLFGYRQVVHTNGTTQLGAAADQWRASTPLTAAPAATASLNGLTQSSDIDLTNTSAALFGQLSWKITDQFRIEPGLRLNYDKKDGSYITTVVNATNTALTSGQSAELAATHYAAVFDDWNLSGDLKLSYHFTPDVNAYVSYARSFKSGGVNLNGVPNIAGTTTPDPGTFVIAPEKVNSYEAGVKTQLLERRATFNVAVFRTDVDDFQANVNDPQTTSGIRGYLANANKVRVQGAEVDFNIRPTENWQAYVNGAYTDATYVSFPNAPCPPELTGGSVPTTANPTIAAPGQPGNSPLRCDISGQWLPGISRWSGSWGVQYQHPAQFLGRAGEFYLGYDGTVRSRWSSNPSRSVEVNGRRALDVGGSSLANFRLGYRNKGSWDVYAWVKNAFDRQYFELLATTPYSTGLVAGQVADPRTWGVTVRAEF